MTGKVYLVGAGPGDSKLITLKAVELLQKADVVLYDRLVSKKIISLIPKSAKKIYVGRAVGDDTTHQNMTNDLMLKHAKSEKNVVRLKGGDPIIFGRGGEEAEFLKEHKVKYEIVPGITSGIGSATYAGIPLTHRNYSSSVVFVTGHEDPEKKKEAVKWKRLAKSVDTIVIMMGLSRIDIICKQLIAGGIDKNTPVAVIQNGTTPQQKMVKGNVSNIAKYVKAAKITPPTNIIIGKVVDLSDTLGWRKNA
ncbi:MAG: uroporphyrinogen-III C-methyltransferase [Thaumarchaeota archaeon]|nr:uroporphyrinogen-III C-methyltransferase [Nitrososphaerota archaeon]